MKKITVSTKQKKEVIDITEELQNFVEEKGRGILFINTLHTTCAITTADLDPRTSKDYLRALESISPKISYNHPHDPSHFPDHFLSTLIGTALTVQTDNGKLILGTWQRIVLIEFDGPRERTLSLSFTKE